MKAEQAWQSVLAQLQMEMPRASYDTWVRDTRPTAYENGVVTVGVRNAYARDWLENRMSATVNRLLVGVLDSNVTVEFVVSKANETDSRIDPDTERLREQLDLGVGHGPGLHRRFARNDDRPGTQPVEQGRGKVEGLDRFVRATIEGSLRRATDMDVNSIEVQRIRQPRAIRPLAALPVKADHVGHSAPIGLRKFDQKAIIVEALVVSSVPSAAHPHVGRVHVDHVRSPRPLECVAIVATSRPSPPRQGSMDFRHSLPEKRRLRTEPSFVRRLVEPPFSIEADGVLDATGDQVE